MRRNCPHQNTEGTSFQTHPPPPQNYRTWCDIIIDYTHINARDQKETSDSETTHTRSATVGLYLRRDIRHCFFVTVPKQNDTWVICEVTGKLLDSNQKDIYTSQNNSHLILSAPICWWGLKACVEQKDWEVKINDVWNYHYYYYNYGWCLLYFIIIII